MKYYGIMIDETLIFIFILIALMLIMVVYYNIRGLIQSYKIDKLKEELKNKKKHRNYIKHIKRKH